MSARDYGPQVLVISAEIINAARRPPKGERVRVFGQLFTAIQIIGLEERLCVLEFFVGEIVRLIELGDLGIEQL